MTTAIGMGVKVGFGDSLALLRTDSLHYGNTSDLSENAEVTFEPSQLYQQQQQQQPLQRPQLYQGQLQLQQQEQLNRDAQQHSQRSGPVTLSRLSLRNKNQGQWCQWSVEQRQWKLCFYSSAAGMLNRNCEVNDGGTAVDIIAVVTEGPEAKEKSCALEASGVRTLGPEVNEDRGAPDAFGVMIRGSEAKEDSGALDASGGMTRVSEEKKERGALDANGVMTPGLEANQEGNSHDRVVTHSPEVILNPLTKCFVPPFRPPALSRASSSRGSRRKTNDYNHQRRLGANNQEETLRRTVHVSNIDQQVSEEQLAALFLTIGCGQVVDCRFWGYPNSPLLRFAFVEFTEEEGALKALGLTGIHLNNYVNLVRVLPSHSAIVPVNPNFLPRSESERAMCARTIYCKNIDKTVPEADVTVFFEYFCGPVFQLRLLGDSRHPTRIAFVEFVHGESAMAALNCSGAILGSLPIWVSPSKTPVKRPSHGRPAF